MIRSIACVAPALVAGLLSSSVASAQGNPNPYAPVGAGPAYYPAGAPPAAPVENAEEKKDSGLGLEWVWLNADAGFGYADLASFNQSTLAMQKTASSGPAFGVGAGVRLLFLTLGLRARDYSLSGIGDLWETGGEAAVHLRIWHIDPYLGIRGGYNFVGSLNTDTAQVAVGNSQAASIHGFNIGPMVGIDLYLAHYVSVGIDVDAQFLFISRPPVPLPAGVTVADLSGQQKQLYQESGSSAGIQISPTAHLGVHF